MLTHIVRSAHLALVMRYLENDNFSIIRLEIESPGGSDEAVGLTHYIIPKTSNQSQRVQEMNPGHHGIQLWKKKKRRRVQLNMLFVHERCPNAYNDQYLLHPLLSDRKLIMTAHVARILLIGLGVGFMTSCTSLRK